MSEQATTTPSPFDEDYGASAVQAPAAIAPEIKSTAEAPAAVVPPVEAAPSTVPTVDYNLYVKEKFGFDSEEVALSEIARLKEQKTAEERKFVNEESKKAYDYLLDGKEDELYNLLHEKKKIDKILSIKPEELNATSAADIVKMEMQVKYPSLTPQQIEHKLNRTYAIPPMPKQQLDETDEEYEAVVNEWEITKESIESDLIIDATIAMPALAQRKTELKLPEIQKPIEQTNAGPSQEDLDKQAQIAQDFEIRIPEVVKGFNGVSVVETAKYGDVSVPLNITFAPSDAERANLIECLKDDRYLAKRWFDEQGVPSAEKIADDIFYNNNRQAIHKKIATEAAAQAIEQYTKSRANINVSGGQQSSPALDTKTKDEKIQEGIWNI